MGPHATGRRDAGWRRPAPSLDVVKRPPSRRAARALVVTACLAVAATACGTSGRTLRDPAPGATAPARQNVGSTSTTAAAGTSTTAGAVMRGTSFTVTTPAWTKGGAIPAAFTCDGADTSPAFTFTGVPSGTVELVFLVTSQSRPDRSLWILAGLGPATTSIPQGGVPTGAVQIVNSSGTARWSGPCPTAGTETYDFALYALSAPSGLTPMSTRAQVDAAVATPMATAALTGTYSRS